MQIIFARAEIVVYEYSVWLFVRSEFCGDLAGMPHAIRHSQTFCREITEAAAVVAAARCDETSAGQKALSRKNRATRCGVIGVVVIIVCHIARLKTASFHIVQNSWPELHAVAQRQGISARCTLVGTGEDMKPSHNYLRATRAIPVSQFIGTTGKGEVDGYADDLRK